MVQHPLEQGGIALQGHPLIGVLEIAVVTGEKDRYPGGGIGVDLLRSLAPLLHRVVDKDVLIHIIRQGGDLRVTALPQLQNGHLFFCPIGGNEFFPQPCALRRAEGGLQRGEVEGDGVGLAPALSVRDIGQDPVLIVPPDREPGEPVKDPLVVGVEDVGAVLVDQHPSPIQAVVGVAADVVPAFQAQHPLSALGQLPGADRTGIAGAHDQRVKCMLQNDPAFFQWLDGQIRPAFCQYSIFPVERE